MAQGLADRGLAPSPSSIRNAEDTGLKSAFHRSLAALALIAATALPVPAALAQGEVKAQFGDLPRKDLPSRASFNFTPVQARTVRLPTDSPYGSVYLGYRLPGARSKDYATSLVLSGALGSQRAGLFGMGVDGTALFGGFFQDPLPEAGIGMAVGVFPAGGDAQPVLKRMQSILADAASKGIDPALVDAAKRKAIASHLEACNPCVEIFDFEAELRIVVSTRATEPVPESLRLRISETLTRLSFDEPSGPGGAAEV